MADARTTNFGDVLRQRRKAARLTQDKLAEKGHLSVRAISDLERGVHRHPCRETVLLLAMALDLPAADLETLLDAARRLSATAETAVVKAPIGRDHSPLTLLRVATKSESPTLPSRLRSFLGRGRVMDEVRRLLETTRLLTLTGTGGHLSL